MFALLLLCLMQAAQPSPGAPALAPPPPVVQTDDRTELQRKLLAVKRVYVDSFGDDAVGKQTQAMVISALAESKRFIITENKDKADASLRGTALEKTSQEFHALNDKAAAGTAVGTHHGSISGSYSQVNGTVYGSLSGESHGGLVARSEAADDSTASTETVDHARIAVRLVSADGDVIWASTQESRGAKYKGASADAADKIVKQLLRDIEKLEKAAPLSAPGK